MLKIDSEDAKKGLSASATLTKQLFAWLIDQVESVIDEERPITHRRLSEQIADVIGEKSRAIEETYGIPLQEVALWGTPVVQSGQIDFNLDTSDDLQLVHNVVGLTVGAKVTAIPTRCVRTLLIDPTKEQEQIYNHLEEMLKAACASLVPGATLGGVYAKVRTALENMDSKMIPYFPSSLGCALQATMNPMTDKQIMADSKAIVEAHEIYHLKFGFYSLPKPEKFKGEFDTYSMQIAETVLISAEAEAQIMTEVPRRYHDISYLLEEQDDEKEEKENESQRRPKIDLDTLGEKGVIRSARLRDKQNNKAKEMEIRRKRHQDELRILKDQEIQRRFRGGEITAPDTAKKQRFMSELSSYPSPDAFPDSMVKGKLHVDPRHESLLVPIQGKIIPFHISTIKNVAQNNEGKLSFLRINFFHPGMGALARDSQYVLPELDGINPYFIREMSFKSTDSKHFNAIFQSIKNLQKRVKNKDMEELEKHGLVDQERLTLIKGKRPTLQELTIRPNISGKKTTGALEAHQNGLRFNSTKGEKIDIIFSNVKHAIFQPVENELIVLLHFTLYNAIMVGNKKTNDIQFFTEAGVQIDDLDSRKRIAHDVDEIHQEQMERKAREKHNRDFKSFVDSVQSISNGSIDFDIPYRELGFYGVPTKSNVYLMPTVNCLVSVVEMPFFLIALEDIEVAHFERVQFNLRNFDIVFVYKDYSKLPVRISNISTEYLEPIRDWLDDINVLFSESPNPLKWANVMKEVNKDLENFVENGGWNFLHDQSESDDEKQQAAAIELEMDSDVVESDFEDGGSDDSEEISEDAESSDYDESLESEEEGMDWDDLEREAEKSDARRKDRKELRKQTKNA